MSETKSFSTCKKEELYDQLLSSIDREISVGSGTTLEEQIEAFQRGDYGRMSPMSVVTSILSNGGSGDHLRGGNLPDKLIDFFVETIRQKQTYEWFVEKDKDEEKKRELAYDIIECREAATEGRNQVRPHDHRDLFKYLSDEEVEKLADDALDKAVAKCCIESQEDPEEIRKKLIEEIDERLGICKPYSTASWSIKE